MNQDIRQLIEEARDPYNATGLTHKLADALEALKQPVGVEPVGYLVEWPTQPDGRTVAGRNLSFSNAIPDYLRKAKDVVMSPLYAAFDVARLQAERDTNRHLLDRVSANYDTLFDRNAQLQAERDELVKAMDCIAWARHPGCKLTAKRAEEYEAIAVRALAKIEGRG